MTSDPRPPSQRRRRHDDGPARRRRPAAPSPPPGGVATPAPLFLLASVDGSIVPSWDLASSPSSRRPTPVRAPVVPIKGIVFTCWATTSTRSRAPRPVWALWPPIALLSCRRSSSGHRVAADGRGWNGTDPAGTCSGWGTPCPGGSGRRGAQFHESRSPSAARLLPCGVPAGRPVAAALWAAPLVFVKEDLGIRWRSWRAHRVAVPAPERPQAAPRCWARARAWGLAWVLLAFGVILPASTRRTVRLTTGSPTWQRSHPSASGSLSSCS
jgi:hypothetical protein